MKDYIDKQTQQPFMVGGALMLAGFAVPAAMGKETEWMHSVLTQDGAPGVLKGLVLASLIAGGALLYAAKTPMPAEKRAQIGLYASALWLLMYIFVFGSSGDMMSSSDKSAAGLMGFNVWFPLVLLAGGVGARIRMFDENSQNARILLGVAGGGLLLFMFTSVSAGGGSMTRAKACMEVFENSSRFGPWSSLAMFVAALYLSLIGVAVVLFTGLSGGDRSKSMNAVSRYVLNFQAILYLFICVVGIKMTEGDMIPIGIAFVGLWLSTMSETFTVGVLSATSGANTQATAAATSEGESSPLPPPPVD